LVLLGAAGVLLALSAASKSPAPSADTSTGSGGPAVFGYAGSASCSSRACHGGDRPVETAIAQQNEYTHMLMYDKHTQAQSVLLDKRAQEIAKNLAVTNSDGKMV